MLEYQKGETMEENTLDEFFSACDDFINCKFLVAEYKLQRMLHILAHNDELCSLIGECLEQFNRDREFSRHLSKMDKGSLSVICQQKSTKS